VREYGMHVHTVGEELKTLHNRHLFATPKPDKRSVAWALFEQRLRALRVELGRPGIASVRECLGRKGGRSRRRMKDGLRLFFEGSLTKSHAKVKEMQKLEFYEVDKIAGKEDRGIQYRGVPYNAALTRYLTRVEHGLQTCLGGNTEVSFLAKGLDLNQRGMALCRMADRFVDPVFVLMDHSRFDAHVNLDLLRAEHSVYKWCCGYDPFLVRLLAMQESNVGSTAGGIRYRVRGKRMSGDVNTACGNSIINFGCIGSWLDASGVDAEVLLDGDDSVIIMERSSYLRTVDCKAHMLKLGMVTELEVVDKIFDVEFCQSKVGLGSRGPWLCPNPRKWLATMPMMPEWRDATTAYGVFRSSVSCMLSQNPRMPMLRPFWRWCKANPGQQRVDERTRYRVVEGYGFDPTEPVGEWAAPTAEERLSFYLNWGIDPPTQVAYETEQVMQATLGRKREARLRATEDVEGLDGEWADWVEGGSERDLSLLTWELADADFRRRWTEKLTGNC